MGKEEERELVISKPSPDGLISKGEGKFYDPFVIAKDER